LYFKLHTQVLILRDQIKDYYLVKKQMYKNAKDNNIILNKNIK